MDVCKCLVSLLHGDSLNSRRDASHLLRLVEGKERWGASDHLQTVLPQNWSETNPNSTVISMVFKSTDNENRAYF
ncbi:uncharacterized protein TNCV_1705231 [Trichonephila clavipes]|uniref:Uncharacterized protein n=1 Tax=Trichonephila clavipes TaxID=2585209 RepID=A0A8X6RF01_TRICX|nr:uncharacterized protein TNCV_1705231 [Trichonephila clavipes]